MVTGMAKVSYGARQNPPCEQDRRACVANKGGRCSILHDTKFSRACPFYKTKAMVRAELKGGQQNG